MTRQELKFLFKEAKKLVSIDKTGKGKGLDTIIVEVYQKMSDSHQITKDDAKEIALCLMYNYAFLYK